MIGITAAQNAAAAAMDVLIKALPGLWKVRISGEILLG
uniref:Uncharacterized protein n=1 Tax=Raoultella ornithinolytica TaxID=54291 RepID=A0A2H4ZGN5_RAOOR|nr:Hypothetical protein [Raoultella ornithinolytica]